MVKDILNAIPVLIISLVATVTTGTALSKIADELQPTLAKAEHSLQEVNTPSVSASPTGFLPSGTPTPLPNQNTNLPAGSFTASSTTTTQARTTTGSFSPATLAQHNKSGNCYIAYKGIVYNVSSHPSWTTCLHHGIRGGRDITSIFPHSTTYFSTLPKVGTIQVTSAANGSTNTGTSSRQSDDSDDEDEREENELEHEDEEEYELEIEQD